MNLFTFEDGIHFIGGELFGVQLVYAKTIERGAVALLEDAVDPVAWGAQASLNDRLALAHFLIGHVANDEHLHPAHADALAELAKALPERWRLSGTRLWRWPASLGKEAPGGRIAPS